MIWTLKKLDGRGLKTHSLYDPIHTSQLFISISFVNMQTFQKCFKKIICRRLNLLWNNRDCLDVLVFSRQFVNSENTLYTRNILLEKWSQIFSCKSHWLTVYVHQGRVPKLVVLRDFSNHWFLLATFFCLMKHNGKKFGPCGQVKQHMSKSYVLKLIGRNSFFS